MEKVICACEFSNHVSIKDVKAKWDKNHQKGEKHKIFGKYVSKIKRIIRLELKCRKK